MNSTCKYCNREHIQCKKGKIQTSEHTINWSRNLSNRLRWSTPAGKVLVGTVLLKTFWSEARRPVALDWHTLWPANSKCKKTTSGFYRPLEWDFSTMVLSWITSKGTIARDCAQDFSLLPFFILLPHSLARVCSVSCQLEAISNWNQASNVVTLYSWWANDEVPHVHTHPYLPWISYTEI